MLLLWKVIPLPFMPEVSVQNESIDTVVRKTAFFQGLPPQTMELVLPLCREEVWPGETMLARAGEPADAFWIIRSGGVCVCMDIPGGGRQVLQTLGTGEVLGWSWLFPPWEWTFSGETLGETRLIRVDAASLRPELRRFPSVGYALALRVARIMMMRLRHTEQALAGMHKTVNRYHPRSRGSGESLSPGRTEV